MAWTEESIAAEFHKHITYWQDKLRLRDITFDVRLVDGGFDSDESGWWCRVKRSHGGDNQTMCDYQIRRGMYTNETSYDVWSTTAHELVHVMNWAMSYAFDPLTDHFSTSQLQMANKLMKQGNEFLAYKWEDILVTWFAADAPPKTIPEGTPV